MTHRVFALALLMTLSAITDSTAEMIVKRDRFTGDTTVTTRSGQAEREQTSSLTLGLHVSRATPQKPGLFFILSSRHSSWTYLECSHTSWLADGVPVPLPESTHDGDVGNGYVLEQILISGIEIKHFRQLASAHQVEYKICNDEYQATATEMQDFRTLWSYVEKIQRGESLQAK
jgi:hypothetical protein